MIKLRLLLLGLIAGLLPMPYTVAADEEPASARVEEPAAEEEKEKEEEKETEEPTEEKQPEPVEKQDAPADPSPLQPLMDWMLILRQRGVDVDYEEARHAALHAWIKSADSKAVVWTGEMEAEEAARREARETPIAEAELWPGRIAYLHINGLYPGAGDAVVAEIEAWEDEDLSGMIMDIRGADGEDLDSARAIAALFNEEGDMLFAFRDRYDQDISVFSAPAAIRLPYPVMILVDGDTRGAAEVLAASLRGIGSGVMLVGQPTRGDLLVREVVELDADAGLRVYLATRRLIAPDGKAYTGAHGVTPNAVVTATDWQPAEREPSRRQAARELREEEKLQLELNSYAQGDATVRRALDILLALKALHAHPVRGGN